MHLRLLILFLLSSLFAAAQKFPLAKKHLRAEYVVKPMTIDGRLVEPEWGIAQVADSFWQNWPYDTAAANSRTEVHILYDDHFLYVGAKCYKRKKTNVIETLKRDFNFRSNDAFSFQFDPFKDGNNGFIFSMNAAGAQLEGLIINGGAYDYTWNNVWFGRVVNTDDYYTVEMAIPWKSIRFSPDITDWSVNFVRNDLSMNEMSSWQALPRNLSVETLAYTGELHFDNLPKKHSGVSLIPYALSSYSQDFQDSSGPKINGSLGADAKVAVTSSLNLDLTVNPDFSQVDADQQVTNLQRFSLYFPEKRTFFLENSDLFSNLGVGDFSPFFSRQIGLHNGQQIPILFGARLTGKINQNWRIGAMDIQTEGQPNSTLESQNFGAAVVQRQVLARSNITGFMINRQAFTGINPEGDNYNRVAGGEFNYYSKNGEVSGKLAEHVALTPGADGQNTATGGWINVNKEKIRFNASLEQVQKNYITDVGFVPRLYQYDPVQNQTFRVGFTSFSHYGSYYFYPKKLKKVVYFSPEYDNSYYWNDQRLLTDAYAGVGFNTYFANRSTTEIYLRRDYIYLLYPSNITGKMKEPLKTGGYINPDLQLNYFSDPRKKLTESINFQYGGFYGGRIITLQPGINYKAIPWGKFGLGVAYNNILFPSPNGLTQLFLISPQMEIFFNTKLSFTTFLQYNTQIDNLNVNARLQWEFRPLSFLYIVYTDNYIPEMMIKKNRALVLKLNYWLNL
jgi:hypothetical protein